MGQKSKGNISNSAIRIFLQNVGEFYDKARGYDVFREKTKEWRNVIQFFSNKCCYCAKSLNKTNITFDHLIPINKAALGLHCWGNVVPSCNQCNKEKHAQKWQVFLKTKIASLTIFRDRAAKIKAYQRKYKYEPNSKLDAIARNLYEDVGEVSMKLIELRLKQAKKEIEKLIIK